MSPQRANRAVTALLVIAVAEVMLMVSLICAPAPTARNMDDVRYQFGSTVSDKLNPNVWCE